MRRPLVSLFLCVLALFACVDAILVSEGSQCAIKCGNVGESTAAEDLSCGDGTFGAFPGQTQKECIQCELNSTHVAPNGVSDLQAMLYNLRYTAGYCIFNHSTVSSTPCITEFACGHFLKDLDHENMALPKGSSSTYDYCSDWEDALIFRCQSCLMELGSQLTLINHMTTLLAACKQKPENGEQVTINGDIFSGNVVSIGDPNAAAETSTFTPKEGLTLGAIIGIAVGGLIAVLIAFGCCIVWRGKRRRRAILASYSEKKYTADGHMRQVMRWQGKEKGLGISGGSIHEVYPKADDSPASMNSNAFMTKPSNRWPGGSPNPSEAAISPQSPNGTQSFSPYISHHASPMETGPVNGQWGAVPIPKAYRRGSVGTMSGRVNDAEQIEMSPMSPEDRERWAREASHVGFTPAPPAAPTFVPPTAPTIRHPGHGRTVSSESIGEAL